MLYTISENDSEPREALEKLLETKGFVPEGDQSTMMRDWKRSKSLNPTKLTEDLNYLAKEVTFSDGDLVTLIVPKLQKFILPSNKFLQRPILRRYKFRFSKEKGLFEMIVS